MAIAFKAVEDKATGVGTQDTAYTASSVEAVAYGIKVINQDAADQTVTIWRKQSGVALATSNKMYISVTVAANDTAEFSKFSLEDGDAIVWEGSDADMYMQLDILEIS